MKGFPLKGEKPPNARFGGNPRQHRFSKGLDSFSKGVDIGMARPTDRAGFSVEREISSTYFSRSKVCTFGSADFSAQRRIDFRPLAGLLAGWRYSGIGKALAVPWHAVLAARSAWCRCFVFVFDHGATCAAWCRCLVFVIRSDLTAARCGRFIVILFYYCTAAR
jgi:hypothetical protein